MLKDTFLNSSLLFSTLTVLAIGCTPDKLSEMELPIPDSSEEIGGEQPQTSTLSVTDSNDLVSPASQQSKLPAADTSAKDVCRRFLELLNREDSDHFELLLTPAAFNVTHRLGFQLPPIATPSAAIELSEPKYNTIRKNLCFIDCQVNEMGSVSEPASTLSMMMRKTKIGWRVAGMLVEGQKAGIQNLLSFESSSDVRQIKSSLENIDFASTPQ